MPQPRKWASNAERQQAYRARTSGYRPRRFIGVDGEGVTSGRDHRYVLLGAHDASDKIRANVSRETGLEFTDVMTFLWEQYEKDRNSVFAGFFLGYDFTQWFKMLPENRARMLFHPELRLRKPVREIDKETGEITEENNPLGPFPVRYLGWEFDILGMKRFKLRPEGEKSWMFINDTGSFFQSSFLTVINPESWTEPVVTAEEYRILKEGKDNRNDAILNADMRRYNELENIVLSRVLSRLDRGMASTGIRLAKDEWFGPGQAAQKWLDKIKAPTGKVVRKAIPSNGPAGDILSKGRMSYYGGWFEIFAHGIIPGTTWEYDINSAYPHIIAQLPCILHSQWHADNTIHDEYTTADIHLVHAEILGNDPITGTMLHRRPDHSIVRPYHTKGWYWADELQAAHKAGLINDIEILEGWRMERTCNCSNPLSSISELYQQRLQVGKNSPEGKALKLIYNSSYGKMAQSLGQPKYANPIYASRITSSCRTMIVNAIATHPEKTRALVMVATDGVYFRTHHTELDIGNTLGSWEETPKENLTLFKPGVYWDDAVRERITRGQDPRFKARGISAKHFAAEISRIDDEFRTWEAGGNVTYPAVTFTSGFSMISPRQALQRGKWGLAGTLGHEANEICEGCTGAHLRQDSDPVNKRQGLYKDGDIWRSSPWETGGADIESTPYDRAFGQPDIEEYGITDDGTVLDSWRISELRTKGKRIISTPISANG